MRIDPVGTALNLSVEPDQSFLNLMSHFPISSSDDESSDESSETFSKSANKPKISLSDNITFILDFSEPWGPKMLRKLKRLQEENESEAETEKNSESVSASSTNSDTSSCPNSPSSPPNSDPEPSNPSVDSHNEEGYSQPATSANQTDSQIENPMTDHLLWGNQSDSTESCDNEPIIKRKKRTDIHFADE